MTGPTSPEQEQHAIVEAPKEVQGHMVLTVPVLVVFRPGFNLAGLRTWQTPMEMLPIIARAVRESFKGAPHGAVKVVTGPLVDAAGLPMAFAHLGLQTDRLPDTTQEESSMLAAQFIAHNFDAALVYEALGGLLKTGVKA